MAQVSLNTSVLGLGPEKDYGGRVGAPLTLTLTLTLTLALTLTLTLALTLTLTLPPIP